MLQLKIPQLRHGETKTYIYIVFIKSPQESSCISHCVDFIKGISQEDPQKKSGLKPVVLIIFLVF